MGLILRQGDGEDGGGVVLEAWGVLLIEYLIISLIQC